MSRVEVSPELLDAQTAATRWGAPFDADLTEVFQVQASITDQVVAALRVRLDTAQRNALAARPTDNPEAYDAYLRAQAIEHRALFAANSRSAAAEYRRAVALDSTFALAWAGLAGNLAGRYDYVGLGAQSPALADSALHAATRALALGPTLPEAYSAEAAYYSSVKRDWRRSADIAQAGLRFAPNNVTLLVVASGDEMSLGNWESALADRERAARLEPRSAGAVSSLGVVYLSLRRYPEARATLDRALMLDPNDSFSRTWRVLTSLGEADSAGARAVIRATAASVDSAAFLAFMASGFELEWVLDDGQQRLLLRLRPVDFGNDRAEWARSLMRTYAFRGDGARARIYADSARLAHGAQIRAHPELAYAHACYAQALAYLGRGKEAVGEAQRAVALEPVTRDAWQGYFREFNLAQVYAKVGQVDEALTTLERLLSIPGMALSPGWLRIDPIFAPLRGNPRFERLIAQPASNQRPAA